jgi:hypothetical protein
MRFTCEQCGKRYTTSDVLQPGRMYRTKCKACGNIIVVKGSTAGEGSQGPIPTPTPAASAPPARPQAPLNPPSAPAIVTPSAAPAAGAPPAPAAPAEPKYIDLFEGESFDDAGAAPAPASGQVRRKGAVPHQIPETAHAGAEPPIGQTFTPTSATPQPTPSHKPLKQTRPPAYFGDIAQAPEQPSPQGPHRTTRDVPRGVPRPPRSRMPLVAGVAAVLVAATVLALWRPWATSPPPAPVARTLPSPTRPAKPPPAPEPVPPAPEPVAQEPSPEELARIEKERARQDKLAKAEREKAEKAAKAEEARLAKLEKLEKDKADKAAKAEQARLAKAEKLEKDRLDKAAKAEEVRLARLEKAEKEKVDKAARAEQERLAKADREKADREKTEKERAEREKNSKAEQERLAKLPAGLSPLVMQTVLTSGKKSFDECVKNPWRGLDAPLGVRQVRLKFTVQPAGKVTGTSIDDPQVSAAPVGQCLKSAATALSFGEFRGDPVQMDTPIVFPEAPAPAATTAGVPATGPVHVVVFTGPKSTRSGGEVGDTVYSERSEDAAITERAFASGVVTYTGQVGFGKGSTFAGIGLNVNIQAQAKPIDATRFKSVTFRLASPTTRSLRLRIIGSDVKISQQGCYPTTLIRIGPQMKEYTFGFKDFDPETWCGANGQPYQKVIPELAGFEIADISIQGKPTSFSVGTITLNP